ncbi:MAG: nucleoside 2-deoxyribosyltransferase domain-containing protein [Candidatus Pacebacteria bacterium]|nr:nucleoside 2-deoxyribosyltransferase domain-containing protein [Candidatus Paceibacterota bacterium]
MAGPTSRHQILEHNWRCLAVYYLRRAGFRGYIYVPEPHGQEQSGDFTEKSFIHYWESSRLNDAKCVAFWIPRKADELLGLNTNLELGIFLGKYSNLSKEEKEKKLFIGWPRDAERMGLPHHYAHELGEHRIYQEIKQLCEAIAQQMI